MKNLFFSLLVFFLLPAIAFSNDREIIRRVNAALDSLKGQHEVEVSSRLGVVTLSGYVASEEDKNELQSEIVSIEDVDTIENNLSIKSTRASFSPQQSGCALNASGINLQGISLGEGSVETLCTGSEIFLTGTLADEGRIAHVVSELQRRYPTATIKNSLQVKVGVTDEVLRANILNSLKSESLIPPTVFLSVKNGVVHFSGTVANHRVIDQILSRAIMIEGVKDALSDVTIE